MSKKGKILTDKQERFCNEYINCLNGAEAARKAGYTQKNADAMAIQLLRKSQVLEYLKSLQAKVAQKINITREDILERYWKLAEGAEKDSDRLKALELTAKMLGFNEPDKIDLTSKGESIRPQIIVQHKDDVAELEELLSSGK